MRCADCKHFIAEEGTPYGSCSRWHKGYGIGMDEVGLNECLVEDDEGWGMVVGPDFGCVLFESK